MLAKLVFKLPASFFNFSVRKKHSKGPAEPPTMVARSLSAVHILHLCLPAIHLHFVYYFACIAEVCLHSAEEINLSWFFLFVILACIVAGHEVLDALLAQT